MKHIAEQLAFARAELPSMTKTYRTWVNNPVIPQSNMDDAVDCMQ
jgi:hypothetical protein